jgi:hypothetical protein
MPRMLAGDYDRNVMCDTPYCTAAGGGCSGAFTLLCMARLAAGICHSVIGECCGDGCAGACTGMTEWCRLST